MTWDYFRSTAVFAACVGSITWFHAETVIDAGISLLIFALGAIGVGIDKE